MKDEGEMRDEHHNGTPCKRHGCNLCCTISTEVPLTEEDARRLVESGIGRERFSEVVRGWLLLRNDGEGRCVLLENGACTVHAVKPEACRLYPLVLSGRHGVRLERTCPYRGEFAVDGPGTDRLKQLWRTLGEERRARLRAK